MSLYDIKKRQRYEDSDENPDNINESGERPKRSRPTPSIIHPTYHLKNITQTQLIGSCDPPVSPTCFICKELYQTNEKIMWYHNTDNDPSIDGLHCAHSAHETCHNKTNPFPLFSRSEQCPICNMDINAFKTYNYINELQDLDDNGELNGRRSMFGRGGKRKSKRQTKKRCCSHKNKTKHCKGKSKKKQQKH
jgi:hypothetical protein